MMKNIFKILIITIILCINSVLVIAAPEISLYIDGEQIVTDVSPVIVNDRTLIPVRCFFEKFNADVEWIDSTKQVVIDSEDKNILLKIEDETAYVNNKPVTLDAAPIIKSDRAFVPVRFISEELNYNVNWNGETRTVSITSPKDKNPEITITQIKAVRSGNSSTVTIKADNFKKPKITTAKSPLRYILDFEDAYLEDGDGKVSLESKDVKEVRYAQHDGYARIVIESPGDAKFTCTYKSDYMTIKVVGEKADDKDEKDDDEDEKSDDEIKEEEKEEEKEEDKIKELVKVDKPVIVIDAGHGGRDTGAIGYDDDGNELIYEEDANLDIALGVQKYLERKGVEVVMTRTTDKSLGNTELEDLYKRAEIANEAEATFFVSIHNNAFSDSEASGTMVLYADTDNKINYGVSSKTLAKNILTPLVRTTGLLNRGAVDSPKMAVLRKTDMPSVLIECAFVTCPQDREVLMDDERLDDISYAIAEGILNTIKQLP